MYTATLTGNMAWMEIRFTTNATDTFKCIKCNIEINPKVLIFNSLKNESIENIDFSYSNLSFITMETFCDVNDKIRFLNLSHNFIQQYIARKVPVLTKVTVLDLSFNRIDTLIDDMTMVSLLYPLTALKVLFVNNNVLRAITYDMFANNGKLEEINLRHNQIKSVDQFTFLRQRNLQKLDLVFNRIVSMQVSAVLRAINGFVLYLDKDRILIDGLQKHWTCTDITVETESAAKCVLLYQYVIDDECLEKTKYRIE